MHWYFCGVRHGHICRLDRWCAVRNGRRLVFCDLRRDIWNRLGHTVGLAAMKSLVYLARDSRDWRTLKVLHAGCWRFAGGL